MRYSNSYDQPTFIHSCCISNFHQKKSNRHFRQKAEKNALKNAQNMTTKLSLCLYEHYDYAKPRSFSTRSLIFSTAIHCLAFFWIFSSFFLLSMLWCFHLNVHIHTHTHTFSIIFRCFARERELISLSYFFFYIYTHISDTVSRYTWNIYIWNVTFSAFFLLLSTITQFNDPRNAVDCWWILSTLCILPKWRGDESVQAGEKWKQ